MIDRTKTMAGRAALPALHACAVGALALACLSAVALLGGCALSAGGSGLASGRTPGPASGLASGPAAAPATVPVELDYGGVFGGLVLDTTQNDAVLHEAILGRVYVAPSVLDPFDDEATTESWTLKLLLDRLERGGARVLTEPPAGEAVAPTAALHHLRFLSGIDDVDAVVREDGRRYRYRISARTGPDQESLCGDGFQVRLGFVVFRGALQALPGSEVAATWNLLAMLPIEGDATIDAVLPDPTRDPIDFCAGIADLLEHHEKLERSGPAFREAAVSVLDQALGPLLPVPQPGAGEESGAAEPAGKPNSP